MYKFCSKFQRNNFKSLLNFISSGASNVQGTLTDGIILLEKSIESLNLRLARLLVEYTANQSKLKQRIAKLEVRYVCKAFIISIPFQSNTKEEKKKKTKSTNH